jgi:hypothetical protein
MLNQKTLIYVGMGLLALSSLTGGVHPDQWLKLAGIQIPTVVLNDNVASAATAKAGGERQIHENHIGDIDSSLGQPIVIEPTALQLVYLARTGNKDRVVWKETPGKLYDEIDELESSGSGKHIAYRAQANGKYMVILDQVESATYDAAQNIRFSSDGEHIAFEAQIKGKWTILLDNTPLVTEGEIVPNTLVFIPGTAQLAFVKQNGEQRMVQVAGQTGEGFDNIFNLAPLDADKDGMAGVSYLALQGDQVWSIEQRIK